MLDLSKITVLIIGPQGTGKTYAELQINKLFKGGPKGTPKTETIQTPKVKGERIIVSIDNSNQIETFFLNPTGQLG